MKTGQKYYQADTAMHDDERIGKAMSKNFFKDGKLPGKGTVTVIAFCLAAVAALGIFTYNRSANELKQELTGIADNSTQTAVPEAPAEDANAPAEVPFTEAAAPKEDIRLEHDGLSGSGETDTADETTVSGSDAGESGSETQKAEDAVNPDVLPDSEAEEVDAKLSGAVVSPVSGEILNPYSGGELVKSKTLNVWKTHDGIDVAAESGSVVRAMSEGKVTSVSRDPMMGVTVVVDHGSGYEGYYCNLAPEVNVSEGDSVSAGTVIGSVGSTADAEIAEPSHLHFGIRKNNAWTDPADVLSTIGS